MTTATRPDPIQDVRVRNVFHPSDFSASSEVAFAHALKIAILRKAGLVVMTTNGRNGFLDALRGSHSERVLSKVRCPLLNLPVGSLLG